MPHFQPIVSLKDGQVLGYEVLVRWQHPTEACWHRRTFAGGRDSGSVEAIDWQIFAAASQAIAAQTDFTGYLGLNVAPRHFRNLQFASNCWTCSKPQACRPRACAWKSPKAP